MHTRNSFKKKGILKEDYQKALKKIIFKKLYFSFEPSPFEWTKLSKTKGDRNWQPVALQVITSSEKFLFSYILSDQV